MKQNKHTFTEIAYTTKMTRSEWLAIRQTGLGGSDAGVALGVNPWVSPLQLYLEKKKGVSLAINTVATTLGNDLEPYVLAQSKLLSPEFCQVLQPLPMMRSDQNPWMLATPDSGAMSKKHGEGIVEAKTALSMYGALQWSERVAPAHYRAQCLHYMAVTGRRWCVIVCLAAGPAWFHQVIKWDDEEIENLIEAERKLWVAIQEDDFEFLIDGTESTKNALNQLHPTADEKLPELDLRENERAQKMLKQYLTAKGFENAAAEDKKEAENALKKLLGEHEIAFVDGHKVQWKNTARGRRFTVKEG